MVSRYGEVYAQWRADPQGFWAKAAEGIDWIRPPRTIFDAEAGVYGRWFPDATLNACYNAVDRHVAAGRGDAYVELHINLWDVAAALVLLHEAGAHVSPFLDGDGPERGNPILACAPGIAEELTRVAGL